MEKTLSVKNKPYVHVCTIGSINHGKTTLTAAITKVLAMRYQLGEAIPYDKINNLYKEKHWGVGIFVSYVRYETPNQGYSHVDCLNHIDCIKNIICNGVMDGVILVVSASEGVTNQTREHIQLISQMKTSQIVVFINKCDDTLDDNEEILEQLVEIEIHETLDMYGFLGNGFLGNDIPVIHGSALQALEHPEGEWGDKILELLESMDSFIKAPMRYTEKPFLMPIEVVHYIDGRGTLACGRVEQGILNVQDKVEIVGLTHEKREVIVADIIMYGKSLNQTYPGDAPALLLQGVQPTEIKHGQVLSKPYSIASHIKFTAIVYFLSKEESGLDKAFYNNQQLKFYFRSVGVIAVITLPDYCCMPGNYTKATIELATPVAMVCGSCFTIRENKQYLGVGFVEDILSMQPYTFSEVLT